MRKIAILVPHYKSWRLLAICINAFKQFPFSIDHEIIVCDGSVGHPSIKVLTETSIGEGVKIVNGDPELPSHGQGLSLAWEQASADCDWAFTCETDSWPLRHAWGENYIKASVGHDLIGPRMALAGGVFVHPCGAMYSRKLIDAMKKWQAENADWAFVPSAAIEMGLSGRAYHVVTNRKHTAIPEHKTKEVAIWDRSGPWQSMISFDNDSFDNYWLRHNIDNWTPDNKASYKRIGYEPGQHFAYWSDAHRFRSFHAPYKIEWMDGRENQQAQFSDIFDGAFRHLWGGSSATVVDGLDDEVKRFKREQIDFYWKNVPQKLRHEIELLEAKYA